MSGSEFGSCSSNFKFRSMNFTSAKSQVCEGYGSRHTSKLKKHIDCSSMYLHDRQNDNVCTQLLSPIDKELSSQPFLPEELVLRILLRLPVRSLLQFRCVCKSWKTIISDPQFVKSHLQGSTDESIMTHQRVASFVRTEPYKILSYPIKTLFENPSTPIEPDRFSMRHEYCIIGSCNGLLCLYDESKRCVRLCNPSTRLKSKRSPTVVERHGIIKNYGFGYDQVNDKYKFLVSILNTNGAKIYTFGEDSWKTIQNFPCTPRRLLGKFVSGTLNWLANKGDVISNHSTQCVILSFNLEKETFGELMLPKNNVDNMGIPILYVLNNCLCVFVWLSETRWVIWSMRDYGVVESWTKLMIISPEKYTPLMPPAFVEPLFISENGVVLLVIKECGKLSLYNFNSGGPDYDYPLISNKLGYDRYIYRESLVSPRQ